MTRTWCGCSGRCGFDCRIPIVERIGQTQDIQESMALNTYARAELVRLVAVLTRLKAARTRPLSDAQMAMAAAQLQENQFMDFTLEDLD